MRTLEISPSAFDEIAQALLVAGYRDDVIGFDWLNLGQGGIVLVRAKAPPARKMHPAGRLMMGGNMGTSEDRPQATDFIEPAEDAVSA